MRSLKLTHAASSALFTIYKQACSMQTLRIQHSQYIFTKVHYKYIYTYVYMYVLLLLQAFVPLAVVCHYQKAIKHGQQQPHSNFSKHYLPSFIFIAFLHSFAVPTALCYAKNASCRAELVVSLAYFCAEWLYGFPACLLAALLAAFRMWRYSLTVLFW